MWPLTIAYLLFLLNLIYLIAGIVLISVGVNVKEYYTTYEYILNHKYFSTSNLLIATGDIIFFNAFFGWFCAIKQNYRMLNVFVGLLVITFILELSAGISGYILKGTTREYITDSMTSSIHKYNASESNKATQVWDLVQTKFDCCGAHYYTDYNVTTSEKLPFSCCTIPSGTVGPYECTNYTIGFHNKGCVSAFSSFISNRTMTIGSIGLSFAAVQVLAIVFACYLVRQVRQDYMTELELPKTYHQHRIAPLESHRKENIFYIQNDINRV